MSRDRADYAKRYTLTARQIVNGQKWAYREQVVADVALDWVEKPLEFINDVLVPELPKEIPVWTKYFEHIAREIDVKLLEASGAVMPDRTFECHEDLFPYEGYGSDVRSKWTY